MEVGHPALVAVNSEDPITICAGVDMEQNEVYVHMETLDCMTGCQIVGRKRNRSPTESDGVVLYEESSITRGGAVKASGEVLRVRNESSGRGPNVICKVELFGKLVGSLDDRKKGWVREMGFGGLLCLPGMKLPRPLCYWLMTRIDPVNERLNVGGLSFRFSCNQVSWVLGIPKGDRRVPSTYDSHSSYCRVIELENKYGQESTSVIPRSGKVIRRRGIAVSPVVVDRLMCDFDDDDEDEFKSLFLMAALDMVLCPTQTNRFPKELLPAICCSHEARAFNWCALVLEKLMASARRFAQRFYSDGFAGGCGGCTLFLAIMYLDRLNRNSIDWGTSPRIKVWNDIYIKRACEEDRQSNEGDFGKLGVLDVAYGEHHPYAARDAECPPNDG